MLWILLIRYSVVLVIAGIVVTAFAKCITKIFPQNGYKFQS